MNENEARRKAEEVEIKYYLRFVGNSLEEQAMKTQELADIIIERELLIGDAIYGTGVYLSRAILSHKNKFPQP